MALAGPFLFSFASQCLTALGDIAYLNVFCFSRNSVSYQAAAECSPRVCSLLNCTESFYATYIKNTTIVCITASDMPISLSSGCISKKLQLRGLQSNFIPPRLMQRMYKDSCGIKKNLVFLCYVLSWIVWKHQKWFNRLISAGMSKAHPDIIHCRWHSSSH